MNFEGLNLTLVLISIIAPLGALDVLYFHIYKYKLASDPKSWDETKTHIIRSLVLGVITLFLAFFRPSGIWFYIIGGLIVFDFMNNLIDAFLEQDSRAHHGGLPRIEYMIHIAGSTWMGMAALSFFYIGWNFQFGPNELISLGVSIPLFLKFNTLMVSAGSFVLAGLELFLMLRSMRKHRLISAA
ncbi:MAG: hypothetical protein HOE90_10230 [Bacteriovoracaceae bacterium]|jgi:hypothetical protein|nr:hypothetical protein [Bacteriovoracaceae bacterium]